MKRPKAVLSFVVIVVLLLVAACQPASSTQPSPTAAAPSAATPAATKPAAAGTSAPSAGRMQQLYEAAKKEGEVVLNVATTIEDFQAIFDNFQKAFPGVKINPISVSAPAVPPRIITEYGANAVTIDVSFGSIGSLTPLIERDLMETLDWSGLDLANPKDVLLGGKALKVYDSPWVFFYNKKSVPEAEAPRTWEDLLDPKWKGKINIHRSPVNLSTLPFAWGEQRARDYMEKLAKQQIIPGARGAEILDRITRAEALIGVETLQSIMAAIRQGAPLEIAAISPQFGLSTSATTFKRAPHPNAARLLMAWLGTADGKKSLVASNRESATPCNASAQAQFLCDKKIELVYEDTVEKAMLSAKLREEYAKILGFTAQ